MRALIEPFKVCCAIIPVMPQPVLDYLSAPVPLLIGLSSKLLKNNKINYFDPGQDLNEEINWIDLDDYSKSLWNRVDFTPPYLSNLKERIKKDYEFIRSFKKNLMELQSDEVYKKVISIADSIRSSLMEHFLSILPAEIDTTEPIRTQDLQFNDESDKEFFDEFRHTLMFNTYINDACKT